MRACDSTKENPLSLLVVPRVTNIHLSPLALMNEVTRRDKSFLLVHVTSPYDSALCCSMRMCVTLHGMLWEI